MRDLCCREYLTASGDVGLCALELGHEGHCGLPRVARPNPITMSDAEFEKWEQRREDEPSAREKSSSGGMCWR